MSTFHLQIATPKGLFFDGQSQSLTARTTEGDVGILSGHANYTAPLAEGTARVTDEKGLTKSAKCGEGILSVMGDTVRIIADSFEWNSEGH